MLMADPSRLAALRALLFYCNSPACIAGGSLRMNANITSSFDAACAMFNFRIGLVYLVCNGAK